MSVTVISPEIRHAEPMAWRSVIPRIRIAFVTSAPMAIEASKSIV